MPRCWQNPPENAGENRKVLVILSQASVEPGANIGPLPFRRTQRESLSGSGVAQCQARVESQVHQPDGVGVLRAQFGERFIQCNELLVARVQSKFDLVEVDATAVAAAFNALFVAGAIEQNAP